VKNLATPLQIALAILLRDSKEQVKAFHDFGVAGSYNELLRFNKSSAFGAYANMDLNWSAVLVHQKIYAALLNLVV